MDVRHRLAANVKRLRKARGLSQEALADAAGLDRTYVSGIERVVRNPTVTVVERMARALDCTFGELLDSESDVRRDEPPQDSVEMFRDTLSNMIIDAEGKVDAKILRGAKARLHQLNKFIDSERG